MVWWVEWGQVHDNLVGWAGSCPWSDGWSGVRSKTWGGVGWIMSMVWWVEWGQIQDLGWGGVHHVHVPGGQIHGLVWMEVMSMIQERGV